MVISLARNGNSKAAKAAFFLAIVLPWMCWAKSYRVTLETGRVVQRSPWLSVMVVDKG
jgi:hypothetical protein